MINDPTGQELLGLALRAHGGAERWQRYSRAVVEASITGALWPSKGQNGLLANVVLTVDLRRERVVTDIVGQDKRLIFEPHHVSLATKAGKVLSERDLPRAAFAGHRADSVWDDLHAAYFNGEALWTYLNMPFLCAGPDFDLEELPTWHEDGEEWRPLRVKFPERIATHTREQVFYFGADGLLRRHEYTVDILGGARGLNYAYDYRDVDGIKVPVTRRVYGYDDLKRKIPEPLLVAIDIRMIQFLE